MTAPNQPNPSGSATQGGLSAFAAKTAAQRKTEVTAPVKNSLETNFFGKWISNMFGGFFNGVLGLISALVYGLKGITGGLIDLTGALKATDTKADNAQNTANGAVQQVAQVIQKVVAFDIKSPVAGWISINPTEYPSFPRALLIMGYRIGGSSSNPNIQRTVDPDTAASGTTSFNATTQFYVYIRIPVDNELTGLNFYARGTPTALHCKVYPMDPNGDLLDALTAESPSLHGEVVSTKHTSVAWVFPAPIVVEEGTWVAVGFRCVGSCVLAAQEFFDAIPPDGFFPIRLSATTNQASGVALPDAVPQADLSWTSGTVPYVAIGNNILEIPNKRNLSDNFDRPDTSVLPAVGPGWSLRSTNGILSTSGMYVKDNEVRWSGTDDGTCAAQYTSPLTTDHVVVVVHVGTPRPTARSRFWACGASSNLAGLGVEFTANNGISLIRRTDVNSVVTIINIPTESGGSIVYGLALEIEIGEVIGETFYPDTVLVRRDGVEIIRTTVTAATVPRGKGRRYAGMSVQRTSFQNSTPILDWNAFDVPDVEVVTP